MKIVDIKTKIIPSNPRSKNYPIGYSGGIASNSNGVTPDLSIYLLKEIWERNFEERTDEYGNEYLYIRKPLAIGGGATMYASNGVVVPSIFDGLPLDNTTIRKNPETGLIEVIGGTGTSFDENAMWSALSGSSNNQINKSHLTTVLAEYATAESVSALTTELNKKWTQDDTKIKNWDTAFGWGDHSKAGYAHLANEEAFTGLKHFTAGLSVGESKKKIYEENGVVYIDADVAVTGAMTFYASAGRSVSTIMDGVTVDEETITKGSDNVLRIKNAGAGSSFDENAMWSALSGSSDNQINKSHLTNALAGYATESWVTSKNYLTSVSIATISDLHANWDALLKAAPSAYVTRWPTISEVTDRKNLIIKLNGGSTEGTNLFTYNVTGEKTINITPAGIGAAASSHNHSWSNITSGKPSTLSGYGITDAYTKTESDSKYPTKTGSGASGTWGISITGNAGSSTKLQTARTLWGQSFDGTKNISGDLTSVGNITGSGTFSSANAKVSDSVYINGIRLHKTADGVITLEGNLAVTGGVTMYAVDPVSASTIMDGVVVDGVTIKKENGKLVAVGGGEAGNVSWDNISGKPSVFPTNIVNITDLHSSWDAVLAAQKPAWLTAVSIATISDLHANWDALLKAAPSAYVTRWPTISEVTGKQNLIVKLNGGTTEGTNQFTYNATGAKTINITPAGIGAAASSHNHSWSNITSGKPTTLAGYGITDAPTKTGSGASGTWGIGITGNAATASKWATARTITLGSYLSGSVSLDGSVNVTLNANVLGLTSQGNKTAATGNTSPASGVRLYQVYNNGYPTTYGNLLSVKGGGAGELLLSWNNANRIYYRSLRDNGDNWLGWNELAFITDNVASATKLKTARTLWGRSFDGTGNVSGNLDNVGNINTIGGTINAKVFAYNPSDNHDGLPWYGMAHYGNNVIAISGYGGIELFTSAGNVLAIGTDNKVYANSYVASNSFRSTGDTGWYNEKWGGGWYMSDSNFLRSTNEKSVYIGNGSYRTAGGGYAANNINNASEVFSCRFMSESIAGIPAGNIRNILGWYDSAASGWTTSYIIGSKRNYNNDWGEMTFGVYRYEGSSRSMRMLMTLDGAGQKLYIEGNILATGGSSFYGSDIRYKSIIHPVMLLALNKIAEAPSFVYRWNRPNMNQNRLNLGGSAQYTQSILPWAVENSNNFLSMDYATVAYTFAVHTARHLMNYETRTDKKIKKLENRVKYLEKQLKKLGYEEVRTLDDSGI